MLLLWTRVGGKFKEISHIGIAKDEGEVDALMERGRQWIAEREERMHPALDFDGRAEAARERERRELERVVSSIENVLLNGCELILYRVFDLVGFNAIDDQVFRQLVHSRLSCPASKAAKIGMSVDKVLNMAKTVTTIVFRLPESGKTFTKTMPMKRHQRITKLFTDEFWVTQ